MTPYDLTAARALLTSEQIWVNGDLWRTYLRMLLKKVDDQERQLIELRAKLAKLEAK